MKTTKQSTFSATLRTTILLASLGGLLVVIGALVGGAQGAALFLVIALRDQRGSPTSSATNSPWPRPARNRSKSPKRRGSTRSCAN